MVSAFFGESIVWVFAFTYFALNEFPIHEIYPINPGRVVAVVIFMTFLFALCIQLSMKNFSGKKEAFVNLLRQPLDGKLVNIAIVVSIIWVVAGFATGYVDSRETVGTRTIANNGLYLFRLFEGIPLFTIPVLANDFFNKKGVQKLPSAFAAFLFALISVLSGGRELVALLFFIFAIVGSTFVPRALIVSYLGGMLALLIGVFVAIGANRIGASVDDQGENVFFELFFRLSEPYGHYVIDQALDGYIGEPFRNFDRLLYLYVPEILLDQKLPINDGPEVLHDFFGYVQIDDYLSLPITFLADFIFRFSLFGIGLAAGYYYFACKIYNKIICSMPKEIHLSILFYCIYLFIRNYPNGLLGSVQWLFYKGIRDILIFYAIYFLFSRNKDGTW